LFLLKFSTFLLSKKNMNPTSVTCMHLSRSCMK
jgi:hypothetical protein